MYKEAQKKKEKRERTSEAKQNVYVTHNPSEGGRANTLGPLTSSSV